MLHENSIRTLLKFKLKAYIECEDEYLKGNLSKEKAEKLLKILV